MTKYETKRPSAETLASHREYGLSEEPESMKREERFATTVRQLGRSICRDLFVEIDALKDQREALTAALRLCRHEAGDPHWKLIVETVRAVLPEDDCLYTGTGQLEEAERDRCEAIVETWTARKEPK